eukprot:318184-Chlamydomonas_euryale.AAC.2
MVHVMRVPSYAPFGFDSTSCTQMVHSLGVHGEWRVGQRARGKARGGRAQSAQPGRAGTGKGVKAHA